MANLGGRDEFEDLEEENMRWATEWDEADDAIHADARRIYLKLAKIRREKRKLLESVHKGGRKRKQYSSHAKFDHNIRSDYFGFPQFSEDGVVHEAVEAKYDLAKFYRRYRMGPKVFERMLHDIQDPVNGHKEFKTGPDALGEMGASALQKITAVIRMLSYGVCFDAIEEYTGVTRSVARDCLYGFCDWLDEAHGATYLGVWTPEAIAAEMEINAA